jgi:hypothetical protein
MTTPRDALAAALPVALYLVAIVIANLSIAAFGPSAVVVNAFLFIGLDLTLRDRLHDQWSGDGLVWKMGALIATGGAISWLLNRDAGMIAVASTVAFAGAAIADGLAYQAAHRWPRLARINASNVVGAAVDSLLFPTIAFGSLMPALVLAQFTAKVAGGFVWSLVLAVPQWKGSPRYARDGHAADGPDAA